MTSSKVAASTCGHLHNSNEAGMAGSGTGESRVRRDLLLQLQAQAQARWEEAKIFEVEAPEGEVPSPDTRFFGNFPYPYMNGLLHLGHAFSLSKLEFASAYHRLCGKRVLFPQGFHCTGMPIKACADKLARELDTYGCPPQFPHVAAPSELVTTSASSDLEPNNFKSTKSKATAKKGSCATQWGILRQSGISEADIPAFRDPEHWLRYFPPLARRDMTAMGCGVDWRRSFITTDMNPYYDSFVRWQFWKLKDAGKVIKDKRYTVFSPLDGQPCADHDRASGEGVGPQEYTLIKMQVLELNGKMAALHGQGRVYLLAATLRPETMYGQTNAWVLPDGNYGAYRGLNGDVYVLTERSALNLSFQELLPERGKPELLLALTGQDLIGCPVRSPHCQHERVYVLPLLTILTSKATGIVTSVPSDSPDDYTALMDLKKKSKLREKYGVEDNWVMPFEVIPIIDIPGLGTKAAQVVCEQLKVQSQNDTVKLAEAKQLVYLKGFTEGTMVLGPHMGRKVSEVKPIIKEQMIAAGQALPYSEPEKQVTSRSGDECVVALTDQWYLSYGEDGWLGETRRALNQLECFSDDAKHAFDHTLGWLNQWACSRSFGLGTRLPWDEQYLIESLSDSTVYMAYYTVAHLLQGGDMYGTPGRSPVPVDAMTNEVWDAIFLGTPPPAGCKVSPQVLAACRREFQYWYPFDLRVSGKDLIRNHLTFSLYNHTAMWPDQPNKWPRAFRCNGHLLLNSEKMSKSTGNFKTLSEAVLEYSADAMRWALADAGDGLDDANFEATTANTAILRLTKELAWAEEVLAPGAGLRNGGELLLHDRVFANEMDIAIVKTKEAYEKLLFREALKAAAYDLTNARDGYRFAVGPDGMHAGLVRRYIEVATLLLAPITPHTSDHVWNNVLGRAGSVLTAGWPIGSPPDYIMQRASRYVETTIAELRKAVAKALAPTKQKKGGNSGGHSALRVVRGEIFVAERFVGWQEKALMAIQPLFDPRSRVFVGDINAAALEAAKGDVATSGLNEKQLKQMVLPFVKFKAQEAAAAGEQVLDVRLPFDEADLLRQNLPLLRRSLQISDLAVHLITDEVAVAGSPTPVDAAQAYPGQPVAAFAVAPVDR